MKPEPSAGNSYVFVSAVFGSSESNIAATIASPTPTHWLTVRRSCNTANANATVTSGYNEIREITTEAFPPDSQGGKTRKAPNPFNVPPATAAQKISGRTCQCISAQPSLTAQMAIIA